MVGKRDRYLRTSQGLGPPSPASPWAQLRCSKPSTDCVSDGLVALPVLPLATSLTWGPGLDCAPLLALGSSSVTRGDSSSQDVCTHQTAPWNRARGLSGFLVQFAFRSPHGASSCGSSPPPGRSLWQPRTLVPRAVPPSPTRGRPLPAEAGRAVTPGAGTDCPLAPGGGGCGPRRVPPPTPRAASRALHRSARPSSRGRPAARAPRAPAPASRSASVPAPPGGVKFASGRPTPLPARSSCASAPGRARRGPQPAPGACGLRATRPRRGAPPAGVRGPPQFRRWPPGGAPCLGRAPPALPAPRSLAAGHRLPSAAGGSRWGRRGCCGSREKRKTTARRPGPSSAPGVRSRPGKGRAHRGAPQPASWAAPGAPRVPAARAPRAPPPAPVPPTSDVSASPLPRGRCPAPFPAPRPHRLPGALPPLSRLQPAGPLPSDPCVSRALDPHRSASVVPPVSIPVSLPPQPFPGLAILPRWSSPSPVQLPALPLPPAGMPAPARRGRAPPAASTPASRPAPAALPHPGAAPEPTRPPSFFARCHLPPLPPAPALDSGHHHTPTLHAGLASGDRRPIRNDPLSLD